MWCRVIVRGFRVWPVRGVRSWRAFSHEKKEVKTRLILPIKSRLRLIFQPFTFPGFNQLGLSDPAGPAWGARGPNRTRTSRVLYSTRPWAGRARPSL